MSETLHLVVMRKLIAELGLPFSGIGQWLYKETEDQLNARRQHIEKVREWARESTRDAIRSEYLSWLSHWDAQLNGAFEELRTHAHEKSQTAFRARMEQVYSAVNDYEASDTVPAPSLKVSGG